jgi:thiol:disulfide interchange protein
MFSGNSPGIGIILIALRRAALAFSLGAGLAQARRRLLACEYALLSYCVDPWGLGERSSCHGEVVGSFCGRVLSVAAVGAPLPYDEHADARATLQQGLDAARASGKDVLVVFGANWCQDCRELDKALHGRTASLIDARFVVVKIDVGNFDKNLDVVKRYGYPIGKGIPGRGRSERRRQGALCHARRRTCRCAPHGRRRNL